MTDPFAATPERRLMIFGHPGHELALFGMLQRHQPDIVVSRMAAARCGLNNRNKVWIRSVWPGA